MLRALLVLAVLIPVAAHAQSGHRHHTEEGSAASDASRPASKPTRSGQAAFGAIQEIIEILEADPATDWSKVDIEALRRHLIDMDLVTLRAEVRSEAVEGGMRFIVSGVGPVKDSIQRMVTAHAAMMNGVGDWTYSATATEAGAILTVVSPPHDIVKLRGLGFIGIMTRGMHHQHHHLMIARGHNPHH
jgi:hypothetical protein